MFIFVRTDTKTAQRLTFNKNWVLKCRSQFNNTGDLPVFTHGKLMEGLPSCQRNAVIPLRQIGELQHMTWNLTSSVTSNMRYKTVMMSDMRYMSISPSACFDPMLPNKCSKNLNRFQLTLYMLKLSEGAKTFNYILCYSSTETWQR